MLGAQVQIKGAGYQSPKKKAPRQPTLPRKTREDCRLGEHEVNEIKGRNPIMPERIEDGIEGQTVEIVKPNLTKAKYLQQTKQPTPAESANQSVIDRKDLPQITDQITVFQQQLALAQRPPIPTKQVQVPQAPKTIIQTNSKKTIDLVNSHQVGFAPQSYNPNVVKAQTLAPKD